MKHISLLLAITILFLISCKKEDPVPTSETAPKLKFKFKFDSTQVRLGNLGKPTNIPSGHSGISPIFNRISSHYLELAPSATT